MVYKVYKLAILSMLFAMLGQQSFALGNESRKRDKLNSKGNRRLIVRYKDNISYNKKEAAHFSAGAYVLKSFDLPSSLEVVEVARGLSVKGAKLSYEEDPNVLYVEPDYELRAFFAPPPNNPPNDPPSGTKDPKFSEQWGLNNEGQTGGKVDADINAKEMWLQNEGDANIVIGVIDTGISETHEDLAANIWTNADEIPGNGIDDDGNGVIDDVHGYNSIDKTGNPADDHGHGTHCAGTIGAIGENIYGGRGIMPHVGIVACKFITSNGSGTTSDAIDCLNYFYKLKTRAKNPVNIVATSNSWGGDEYSQALEDAIKAHQEQGILFIAAASNESSDNDVKPVYPATFPLANIISVAATDHNDEKADFSNYGRRTVHVGAPGVNVFSTVLRNGYEKMDGTSMAAPHVAGLAGMIYASDPSLNYTQIKNLIIAGGTPVESLKGITVSGRRIRAIDQNGFGSLSCENQIIKGRLSPMGDNILVEVGGKLLLSAININCDKPNGEILVPVNPLNKSVFLSDDGLGIDSASSDGFYSHEWIAEHAGKYEFVFSENDKVNVKVYNPTSWPAYTYKEEEFKYRTIEGTKLEAQDDSVQKITSTFPIHFAGDEDGFDAINVSSNGTLSFTNSASVLFDNQSLPKLDFMSLIAIFWDDLNPTGENSGIYYATIGEAPNREFVVEWRNVEHFNTIVTSEPVKESGITFQVVFNESSPDIIFNYLDVDFGSSEINNGGSATIGIQSTQEKYSLVGFNSSSLKSNQSLRFSLAPNP